MSKESIQERDNKFRAEFYGKERWNPCRTTTR